MENMPYVHQGQGGGEIPETHSNFWPDGSAKAEVSRAGFYLGRVHFWRDRGSGYLDGVRTSLQVGFIGAGVLKGAGFTDTFWAVVAGVTTVVLLESAKVIGGWIDYRLGAIHVQQRAHGWQTNPAESRKIELMEAILRRLDERP